MQDKTEWKLNGQVLVFTLPLTDQVWVAATNWHRVHGNQAVRGKLPLAGLTKELNDCCLIPQVSVIKVKIHEATGMPAGKQKLQYEVSQFVHRPAPWVLTPLLSQKLNLSWKPKGE